MEKTISATEARIHFGKIMELAQETPIIVERSGVPQVVVISKRAYDALRSGAARPDWRQLTAAARRMAAADLQGRPLPDPAEVLRQLREEQNERYDALR